jgi:probable HAF family extracellular repeat protein
LFFIRWEINRKIDLALTSKTLEGKMKAVSFFIGVIFFFCVAGPSGAAASYTITDLGVPDGPYVASYAQSISNSGVVVGWAENSSGEHQAFVWENDTMTNIGTLGGDESEALHINDLEQVVGWAENTGGNAHAFRWDGDTMTDLGTLGGSISRAFGISISGQVAGYSNTAGSSDYHACLWEGDTVTDLGTLGGPWSKAYGMNDNGQVVGKSDTGETVIDLNGIERNIVLACLWQGDTAIDLGSLGGLFSQANHINNPGQIVGSSYLATGNNTHAFIWESGVMTDLGTLGGNASEAHGINNFSQVVGFSDGSAFIWENGTMTDLNDSITPGSGWTLIEAYDINNAGQIVGWGINPDGEEHAFILTPKIYDVCPVDTIQAAIDAASEGDTVVVAPGVYYENINFKGKNIVLTSFDPFDTGIVEKTIIDGSRPDNPDSGSVVTFDGSETKTCVLSGFTIRNGSLYGHGNGIYGNNSFAVIENNQITSNDASYGIAVVYRCHGVIRNNLITSNHGTGLRNCDGLVEANIIENNSGDGLAACQGTIQHNTIIDNDEGLVACNGLIQGNTIIKNRDDGLRWCDGLLKNNVIGFNGARGLNSCDGTILNNTIISNATFGVWDANAQGISNCIIWGNGAGPIGQSIGTPNHSCIQNWPFEGQGNISETPVFAYDGYHLLNSSPCIDIGDGESVPVDDIDKESRPQSLEVDIGADEYKDLDSDGLPDWIEVLGLTNANDDYDSDGMPNAWEYNNQLNPTIFDADNDPDSDGVPNIQEYLDNTDPYDPFSKLENHVFYVSFSGSNIYPYQSWADAANSIQDAIDVAFSGDTVMVAKGIYYENIYFQGKNIVLTSTYPDSQAVVQNTIIDGSTSVNPNIGAVVTFDGPESSQCKIRGFTIQNGTGNYYLEVISNWGGGIAGSYPYAYGIGTKATIENNLITSNLLTPGGNGGGIFNCDGIIKNNTISHNRAVSGGGLLFCDGVITNNHIINNTGTNQGGGLGTCQGKITNNVIMGNQSYWGGGLHACDGMLMNNAVIANSAGGLGTGIHDCYGTIKNCIVWGNYPIGNRQVYACSTPSYSCIEYWDGGGEGNTNVLPRLAYDGYHLTSISPCIDFGISITNLIDDIDGESRPQGPGIDIGADEYKDSDGDALPDWLEMLGISEPHGDRDGDNMPNNWEFINGLDPWDDDADKDEDSDSFTNYEEYLDDTDPQDPFSRIAFFNYYVSPQGSNTYPYKSWEDAANAIQLALDAAHPGDTILVGAATYYENIRINGKELTVSSVNPDSASVVLNTIIDGSENGPVVTFSGVEGPLCVFKGFTVQNGSDGGIAGYGTYAKIESNNIIKNYAWGGGGISYCNGTIRNNVIAKNSASYRGGGVYACDGLISNNVICGNSSGTFGAGLDTCEGAITGNIIANNLSRRGGALIWCGDSIINNTIVNNLASEYGGGLYSCSGVINNVVWGNSSDTDPQFYECDTPTYSCIQDWTGGGEGNISSDPMFVGNPYDTGTWTADAVYDTNTFQSTLIDASAAWGTDILAGIFLNPDTATVSQHYILSNTDTTITVWGDLSGDPLIGKTYAIYDYHLEETSPCIDSGYMFADVGEYDLDKNPRYNDASDSSGWDGTIKGMVYDSSDTLSIAWQLIDMGAYEYQPPGDIYDTFILQAIDDLDSGSWKDIYIGASGMWIDTGSTGAEKRFYRVYGE